MPYRKALQGGRSERKEGAPGGRVVGTLPMEKPVRVRAWGTLWKVSLVWN